MLRAQLPRRKKETDEQWATRQDKHQVEIARIEALPRKRSVQFMGKTLRLFQVERLFAARNSGAKLRAGNFAQNSLGEWFLNVTVSEAVLQPEALDGPDSSTGMDPGLKHATVTSNTGQSWDLGHAYRDREADIAQSQRRGHKKQAKRQHADVKNARKDAQFKAVREIVDRSQHIFIGNANCALVNHGNLAKAGYDHAWGMLRTRLVSVGHRAGRIVLIVNEKDTTSTCSCCWALTGPTGRDMLIVRSWTCSCGVTHERDQNSGENIRQRGWIVLRSMTPPRHGAAVCGNESSG